MSVELEYLAERSNAQRTAASVWNARAEQIRAACHPKQRGLIDSVAAGTHFISARCPRRAGKSYGFTALALWYGEKFPGSRVLIISLTLKSTRENYWSGAPGGIFYQSSVHGPCKDGLNLKFNHTDSVWMHENGSRGRLAGAETRADIEYLRGAAAEADICIIDECKSFAPDLLAELIRDVVEPGLMTRDGFLVIGGTPGSIPVGPFYDATSELARGEGGCESCGKSHPTCIPVGCEADAVYRCPVFVEDSSDTWRLHTWTLEDNSHTERTKNQWKRALRNKRKNGWTDDHPTWRREYLGQWVTDATDLVYAWAGARAAGKDVCWTPREADLTKANPTGLPPELGPWHLVMGLDIGYVDESAFVLAAYSETTKELRHVHDFKRSEMLCDDFAEEVLATIGRFGLPEAIVADTGGAGAKMLIETINARYGLGIMPAEKKDKQAHVELINSDFAAGRVKIIPGTDLAHELAGLQWDLSRNSKMILARTGSLREDPKCPNHLCDALLYLWRYSWHFFSEPHAPLLERGTVEWYREQEAEAMRRVVARKKLGARDPLGLAAMAAQRPPGRDEFLWR